MACMTKKQTEKFESLANYVDDTVHNVKKAHVELLKVHHYESTFKDNKCCIVLLITFALLFLSLIFINMK